MKETQRLKTMTSGERGALRGGRRISRGGTPLWRGRCTMIKRIVLLFLVPALAACKAPTGTPSAPADPIRVSCVPRRGEDDERAVSVVIENVSDVPLYLFDSARMPYLLDREGELVILYGVNPPDPHVEHFMIEIPTTQVLPPGERIVDEVSLTPLRLGDHYGLPRERNSPVTRQGTVTVQCTVGWGYTPILAPPEEQQVRNIDDLLAWQQLSRAAPVEVELP